MINKLLHISKTRFITVSSFMLTPMTMELVKLITNKLLGFQLLYGIGLENSIPCGGRKAPMIMTDS